MRARTKIAIRNYYMLAFKTRPTVFRYYSIALRYLLLQKLSRNNPPRPLPRTLTPSHLHPSQNIQVLLEKDYQMPTYAIFIIIAMATIVMGLGLGGVGRGGVVVDFCFHSCLLIYMLSFRCLCLCDLIFFMCDRVGDRDHVQTLYFVFAPSHVKVHSLHHTMSSTLTAPYHVKVHSLHHTMLSTLTAPHHVKYTHCTTPC